MNEPPVDSLPPWQMAQDRGGHRGQGGGFCGCVRVRVSVCVHVCLHVSERERERGRGRVSAVPREKWDSHFFLS